MSQTATAATNNVCSNCTQQADCGPGTFFVQQCFSATNSLCLSCFSSPSQLYTCNITVRLWFRFAESFAATFPDSSTSVFASRIGERVGQVIGWRPEYVLNVSITAGSIVAAMGVPTNESWHKCVDWLAISSLVCLSRYSSLTLRVRDTVQAGAFNVTYNGRVYIALRDSFGSTGRNNGGSGGPTTDATGSGGSSILPIAIGACSNHMYSLCLFLGLQ
jgi:hypothetical protein